MEMIKKIATVLLLAAFFIPLAEAKDQESAAGTQVLKLHQQLRTAEVRQMLFSQIQPILSTRSFQNQTQEDFQGLCVPSITTEQADKKEEKKKFILQVYYDAVKGSMEKNSTLSAEAKTHVFNRLTQLQKTADENPLFKDYAVLVEPFLFLLTDTPAVGSFLEGQAYGTSFYALLHNILSTEIDAPSRFLTPHKEVYNMDNAIFYYAEQERFYKINFDYPEKVIFISFVKDPIE